MPRPKRTKITAANPLPLVRSHGHARIVSGSARVGESELRDGDAKRGAQPQMGYTAPSGRTIAGSSGQPLAPIGMSRTAFVDEGQGDDAADSTADVIGLAGGKKYATVDQAPAGRSTRQRDASITITQMTETVRALPATKEISKRSSTQEQPSVRKPLPAPRRDQDFESYLQQNSSSPQPFPAYPPSAQRQSIGGYTTGTPLLSLSNFKRRPRQPSLLRMVQAQNAASEIEDGPGSGIEDSILRELDASSPANDQRAGRARKSLGGALSSSARKRKVDEMEDKNEENEENVPPSSPPAVVMEVEVVQIDADTADEVPIPGTTHERHPRREDRTSRPTLHTSQAQPEVPAHSIEHSPQLPSKPTRRTSTRSSHHRSKPAPKPTRRTPTRRKEKWEPAIERSPTPALTATSPISSSPPPHTSSISGIQAVIAEGEHRSRQQQQASRVKVTHRTRDGRAVDPKTKSKTAAAKGRSGETFPTTATLRALLPKRRGGLRGARGSERDHDTFDLPSSSPGTSSESQEDNEEDADEAYGRRQTGRKPLSRKSVNVKSVRTVAGLKTAMKAKGKAGARTTTPVMQGRTYGRASRAEDGENGEVSVFSPASEGDVSDVIVLEPATGTRMGKGEARSNTAKGRSRPKGPELQAAAEKFKEVDDWELSFESCDVHGAGEGRGSSPWR